jgi:FkbM family methyltransferase
MKVINRIKVITSALGTHGMWYVVKKIAAKLFTKLPFSWYARMSINGFRMHLFPTLLTHNLFADKRYRAADDAVYRTYLRKGDTAIDAGANIGSSTLLMSLLVGETGRVLSFEPSKRFYSYLKRNIALNGYNNIQAYNYALGDKATELAFNEQREDDTTYRIEPGVDTGVVVKVHTLDSYTSGISHVRLLKIDVEGYELFVLRGAQQTLQKTEILYIEFSTNNLRATGTNPSHILDALHHYFDVYEVQNGTLVPFVYMQDRAYGTDLVCLQKSRQNLLLKII